MWLGKIIKFNEIYDQSIFLIIQVTGLNNQKENITQSPNTLAGGYFSISTFIVLLNWLLFYFLLFTFYFFLIPIECLLI